MKNNSAKKFMKTASALMSGRMFYTAASFVIVLIQSRFIGPDVLGTIDYFNIPIGYLWIITFGMPSALARELPYFISKGEIEKAEKYVATTEFVTIVMSIVCSVVFAVMAVNSFIKGNYLYAMGWAFQIVNGFVTTYSTFLVTTYRTTDEFIKIARSNYICGIATMAFFPLIFINPYFGLMMKNIMSPLVSNGYLFIKRPFKKKPYFDKESFTNLVKFGIPIVIVGYIESSLWLSLQRTMIVNFGGTELLGCYGFMYRILTALLIVPKAVNDILRPKYAAMYAENNENIEKTIKGVMPTILASTAISAAMWLAGALVGSYFIEWLLPKYSMVVPSINFALMIVPITALSTFKYIFVVCKKNTANTISTVFGFAIGILTQYLILKNNNSIEYLFLPYVIGKSVNVVASAIIVIALIKKERLKCSE